MFSGSGPYTVTFTEGVTLANAHNSGALVAQSPTLDRTHPSIDCAEKVKNTMVNIINTLSLP
jgi:hypothetical protein